MLPSSYHPVQDVPAVFEIAMLAPELGSASIGVRV